ncbi:MAG: hypothetical protein Q9221_000361 [Calogaya cf. arnoldii]
MPPANSRGLPSLRENEPFYLGVRGDRFYLRTNVVTLKPSNQYIENGQLAALSLTEVCRKYRIGKFAYLPKGPKLTMPPVKQSDKSNTDRQILDQALQAFYRLPTVVFIPQVWNEVDMGAWDGMKPLERLASLNAYGGGIRRKDMVLPLDLTFPRVPFVDPSTLTFNNVRTKDSVVTLNGFGGATGGCKAVLAIVGKAYLAWHSDIRPTGGANGIVSDWYDVAEKDLQGHHCASGQEVINKALKMYFSGRPDTLMEMDTILTASAEWRRLNKRWLEAQGRYHPETG